jgi:hypothetical protein
MAKALNRCYFTAGSSGTAHFDDGTAVQGFRNLSDAGAQHGVEYAYVAENAARTEVEMGVATYNSVNGQLERADADVEWSTNSNDRVNFSNPPFVLIVRRVQDVVENTLNGNQITVVDEDNMASDSATAVPTQQSVKAYADSLLGANDAMVFKGGIDASGNPNYPGADSGHAYKITVAGKIGGASGPNVQVNDTIICTLDSSASGDHATVGANWVILQTNLDAATTSSPGYVELADTTETDAHSDSTLAVTPAGLVNHLKANAEDQTISGGASITKKSLGSGTGTITVDVSDRPCQTIDNDTGAFALDVGTTHEGSTVVIITNGASAGAITTSGFDDVRGDAFTTTNGHVFRCTVEYWGSGMKWLFIERIK